MPGGGAPPFLLLRSFKHDEIVVGSNQSLFSLMRLIPSPFTNDAQLEDRITKQIEEIGPFVTIGKLNEALPPLGASREYLDENWKESISRLIELSALVVVILVFTESLLWEIDQIFLTKSVSQVLFIMPFAFIEFTDQDKRQWLLQYIRLTRKYPALPKPEELLHQTIAIWLHHEKQTYHVRSKKRSAKTRKLIHLIEDIGFYLEEHRDSQHNEGTSALQELWASLIKKHEQKEGSDD